jgi:hypothetical protein
MAFTVAGLAAELGIDPATLASKQDIVARYDGYFSQADTQYAEAKSALDKAARDQQAIDEQIKSFGITEARITELTAANAALKAAMESAKSAGLNIDLSGIPNPTAPPAADPIKTLEGRLNSLAANMSAGMKVQTKYYSTFGKPLPVDIDTLIGEATMARMPVEQYAEQKFQFSAELAKQQQAQQEADKAKWKAEGAREWQDAHPVTSGHPGLARGRDSQHARVIKPRTSDEQKSFRNMTPRERIANSVSRTREALQAAGE